MRARDRLLILLRSWFGAGRMDAEFGEELQAHLDRQTQANLDAGMTGREAHRAARLSFGHVEGLREEARAARAGAVLRQLIRDASYGMRLVRRAPVFAVTGIAIVALGIAATTAIFSVVYGVALRPLPYLEPDRLVNIWWLAPQLALPRVQVTAVDHQEWQASNHVFSDIALVRPLANFNLTGDGEPERLFAALASPNLFRTLGVAPAFGRVFTDEESMLGQEHVVLLSDGLWRRRFGGDRGVVGRSIALSGIPHTVVGVMKPDFQYPGRDIQIWTPLAIDPAEMSSRLGNNYIAVARLKPGMTLSQASGEMDVIAGRQLAVPNPAFASTPNPFKGVEVVPLIEQTVGGVRRTLYVLLAAVFCLLAIACLNLASLLAARTAARAREFAVRLALGASRVRLALQAMAEVTPIVGIGGLLGMAIAAGAVAAFVPLAPATLPRAESIDVSWPVLLFSVAMLVLTGLMGALLSAVQAWRSDFTTVTRNENRSATTGRPQSRSRNLLVIAQIALVLPLLVAASLLTRSLSALSQVAPGFRPDNVLSLQVAIPRSKYPKDTDVAAFSGRLVERVAAVHGVESVSMVNRLPLAGVGQVNPLQFEETESAAPTLSTGTRTATPDYFQTMSIPLIEGRFFTSRDNNTSTPVAIIDDRIARALWPGQTALGRRLRFPFLNLPWIEIVGVVGHVHHDGLDSDPRPQVYFNYLQRAQDRMALVVRGSGDVAALAPSILQAIREVDRDQPVYDVRTMREVVERSTAQQWLSMTLVTTFAAIALLLAAVGVYGLVSYGVTRRAREFGVRLALGATRAGIARLVVGRAAALAAAGIGLGMVLAITVTRAMQSLLFGVSPDDLVSFGIAAATLAVVALVASYVPAQRAAAVDPAVTLRAD